MTVQWETISRPNTTQDPAYFQTDDFMNWKVTGDLAPGASYTYTPRWPTSWASELPAATADVTWSGATKLTMTTVVPQSNQVPGIDPSVAHIGNRITAPVYSNSAQLCMFMTGGPSTPSWNYSITITNTGSQPATGVSFTGQESNGYTANYGRFCNRADADSDGWNDTLEQGLLDLSYPAASTTGDRFGVLGSDYLTPVSRSATSNDEVDASPVDLNDDGAVTSADVAIIQSWVGQGTGVPFDRVDYSGVSANTYSKQSALWRRYDLDGDGLVTQHDVAWVQAEVARPQPDPVDVIAPRVVLDRSYVPATVAKSTSVWLGAYARDNRALMSVSFSVDGSRLSQQCTTPMNEATDPTQLSNPAAGPEYGCVWAGSRKTGPHTVTVQATDAAGNTSTDTMTVNVVGSTTTR
jgi:Dockerin type I domain